MVGLAALPEEFQTVRVVAGQHAVARDERPIGAHRLPSEHPIEGIAVNALRQAARTRRDLCLQRHDGVTGPARFDLGPNGEAIFRYDGKLPLTFDTFLFPSPDYNNPNSAFNSGFGSLLMRVTCDR